MSASTGLRLHVSDLLRHAASRRAVRVAEPIDGLASGLVSVPSEEPVLLDLALERVHEGIVARGTVLARWESVCGRCLSPISGEVEVRFDELFEPEPLEGETYPLEHETIDLEQMVRDVLLVEMPTAPRCRPDCAGLCPECGAERNAGGCTCTSDDSDPRWAALRSLQP